jgi:hypothetical protein
MMGQHDRYAMASIFQINQAMSRIYSVGAAMAITLWSASSLRQSRLPRAVAVLVLRIAGGIEHYHGPLRYRKCGSPARDGRNESTRTSNPVLGLI